MISKAWNAPSYLFAGVPDLHEKSWGFSVSTEKFACEVWTLYKTISETQNEKATQALSSIFQQKNYKNLGWKLNGYACKDNFQYKSALLKKKL